MSQKSYYSKRDEVVYVEPKNHLKHDIIFVIVAAFALGLLLSVIC